ncbi:hypothetical protein Peur_021852 [Populus x canadensis]
MECIASCFFTFIFLTNEESLHVCVSTMIDSCCFCCRRGNKLAYPMMDSPGFQFSRFCFSISNFEGLNLFSHSCSTSDILIIWRIM